VAGGRTPATSSRTVTEHHDDALISTTPRDVASGPPGLDRPVDPTAFTGHRPRRGVRDRLQALSRPPPARWVWAVVAWPRPPRRTMQAVSFEADQAALVLTDPDVVVVPIVAVHGAQVPWGKVVMNGVPVVAARRLPSRLGDLRRCWGPRGSPTWLTRPGSTSTPPFAPRNVPGGYPSCCWCLPSANGRCSPWSARAQHQEIADWRHLMTGLACRWGIGRPVRWLTDCKLSSSLSG
jgi:hypothetical protein